MVGDQLIPFHRLMHPIHSPGLQTKNDGLQNTTAFLGLIEGNLTVSTINQWRVRGKYAAPLCSGYRNNARRTGGLGYQDLKRYPVFYEV